MKQHLLALLIFAACSLQASVTLVRDRAALADIIVPSGAHPAVSYAAEELRHWVREISGAALAVSESPGSGPVHIRLEVNPAAFPEDLAKLRGNDGYAVRSRGSDIHIIGSCPKGVLNGVYRWLFRNTDIIWARPNPEFGTLFTPRSTLVFQHNDYLDLPVFTLRGWQIHLSFGQYLKDSELWQNRNCSNWSAQHLVCRPEYLKYGQVFEYGSGHNLIGKYLTEKKYYDSHPEYYALLKGKRKRPSLMKYSSQLCFTSEEMTQAFIRELDEKISAHPGYATYRIMIEDNWNLCECPACTAPVSLPDGRTLTVKDKNFRSTQFFLFLNKIARHMQKHHPGKQILTFAYFFTETPPACPVEPNISISFCPIGKDSKHPLDHPRNHVTLERLQGWLKTGAGLTWREYFGLVPGYPRPTDTIAMQDWRKVSRLGIRQTYSEMNADGQDSRRNGILSWDANAMYFWVMANAAWNPEQDCRKLRDEFLRRVFQAAAPDVREYYDRLEKAWFRTPGSSRYNDKAFFNWKKTMKIIGDPEILRSCLVRAESRQMTENGRKMLARIRKNFEENLKQLSSRKISVPFTGKRPVFNSGLNDPAWQKAVSYDQFALNYGRPFHQNTEVKFLYDLDNLYIGVRCDHDDVKNMPYLPPTPGKKVFPNGEGFEIYLTAYWKGRKTYAQVIFDPSNNHYTSQYPTKWTSEAAVTPAGWTGMAAISWKSLCIEPRSGLVIHGAFVRQFMKNSNKKAAPRQAAALFEAARHRPDTFTPMELK